MPLVPQATSELVSFDGKIHGSLWKKHQCWNWRSKSVFNRKLNNAPAVKSWTSDRGWGQHKMALNVAHKANQVMFLVDWHFLWHERSQWHCHTTGWSMLLCHNMKLDILPKTYRRGWLHQLQSYFKLRLSIENLETQKCLELDCWAWVLALVCHLTSVTSKPSFLIYKMGLIKYLSQKVRVRERYHLGMAWDVSQSFT
jgi:hypothetical protein